MLSGKRPLWFSWQSVGSQSQQCRRLLRTEPAQATRKIAQKQSKPIFQKYPIYGLGIKKTNQILTSTKDIVIRVFFLAVYV